MRLRLRLLDHVFVVMQLTGILMLRQVLMKQRLMLLIGMTLLQLLRRGYQLAILRLLLMLRRARLAVRRLLLNPTVHHWLYVARVVVPGVGDRAVDGVVVTVVVVVVVVAAAVAAAVVGVAVAVATAEIGEGGSVHAVRAGVIVGSVAGIVP